MKPTTRTIRFPWPILFFLSGSILSFIPPSQDTISSPVYTVTNKPFLFNDTEAWFIVLKNDRNCLNCFVSINEYITSKKSKMNCRFAVVISCDSTALDRKRAFADTKRLMPGFDTLLFQYKESPNSWFRSMHTIYTPEILILKNSSATFIPYKDIFDNSTLEILPKTQLLIASLLDGKQ